MYCTPDDITKRLPMETQLQLADDQDMGAVDEAIIAAVIADAGEIIDGYLRSRYALPLASASPIVTSIAVDLCVYALYGRRAEFETPERISDNHKNALKLLDKINAGTILLGLAAPAVAPTGTSSASFSGGDRVFTRESLR